LLISCYAHQKGCVGDNQSRLALRPVTYFPACRAKILLVRYLPYGLLISLVVQPVQYASRCICRFCPPFFDEIFSIRRCSLFGNSTWPPPPSCISMISELGTARSAMPVFSRTFLRYVRIMACLSSVTLLHPRHRLELFGNIFVPPSSETRTVCI